MGCSPLAPPEWPTPGRDASLTPPAWADAPGVYRRERSGYPHAVNWTWSIRSGDGGMNGLEFALATTAGDFSAVLIHAAPSRAQVEIRRDDGVLVAQGEVARQGDYSPMTLL